jgi:divalent metal cation (Fe/Co/Zn/Cd) transporter
MCPARQPSHLRSGLRVSAVAAGWTLAASVAGVWIGVAQHSVALLAFGAVGLLDAAGSVTLVVHFALARTGHHRADHTERVAVRLITIGLVAVGVATVIVSALRLVNRQGGSASWAAIALAGASLGVLTVLALRKRWVARVLPSHALLADSHLSAVGAVLAAVTLVGVVATRTLGWWWADPAAAVAIGAAAGGIAVSLAREAGADADEPMALPGGS